MMNRLDHASLVNNLSVLPKDRPTTKTFLVVLITLVSCVISNKWDAPDFLDRNLVFLPDLQLFHLHRSRIL